MVYTLGMTKSPRELAEQSRNATGKIDVHTLYQLLTDSGRADVEAVDHMIALGCPTDLAWDCYYRAPRH